MGCLPSTGAGFRQHPQCYSHLWGSTSSPASTEGISGAIYDWRPWGHQWCLMDFYDLYKMLHLFVCIEYWYVYYWKKWFQYFVIYLYILNVRQKAGCLSQLTFQQIMDEANESGRESPSCFVPITTFFFWWLDRQCHTCAHTHHTWQYMYIL